MRCEDVRVYVLASASPLTVLTHRHPTPGMVVVGAGVRPGAGGGPPQRRPRVEGGR